MVSLAGLYGSIKGKIIAVFAWGEDVLRGSPVTLYVASSKNDRITAVYPFGQFPKLCDVIETALKHQATKRLP